LARRAHSEGELASKLKRAGYPSNEITATLAKLRGWRYVDDRAYAIAFARSAVENKRWGPVRIARTLKQRGVGEAFIEEALAFAFQEGEREVVKKALARFRRQHRRRGTAEQQKARAYRHLTGRGFSPDTVFDVLGKAKFIQENKD
jgi:regulatory protein